MGNRNRLAQTGLTFVILFISLCVTCGAYVSRPVDEEFYLENPVGAAEQPEFCFGIQPCSGQKQVLVLLDVSASMNKEAVNQKIFPFLQKLSCLFDADGQAGNQIGLITFNSKIETPIPLAPYTFQQWVDLVDEVKAKKPCCSCCTPHAEAFDAALEEFNRVPGVDEKGSPVERITLLITDGVPHQNYGAEAYDSDSMPHAYYKAIQVSNSAQKLKLKAYTRIVVVNVPRKTGELADLQYFQGIFRSAEEELICSRNAVPGREEYGCHPTKRQCCLPVDRSTFPIVSIPTEQNIFNLKTFDGSAIQELVNRTQYYVCEVEWVPVCQVKRHELMFIIDSSRSILQSNFRGELLDIVEALHQSLAASVTVSGVIAFGDGVRLVMPLSNYSINEFSERLQDLRTGDSNEHPGEAYCCACCTPTAEALELAEREFSRQRSDDPHRRVILITDGEPAQVKDGSKWSKGVISKRRYIRSVVPTLARRLKRIARVFELRVPAKATAVKKRRKKKKATLYTSPAERNFYKAKIWNVAKVTAAVLSKLCENGVQFT